jgi:hypothetical protein
MTCPLTFSSAPAACVVAYRDTNDEVGCRDLDNLERGVLRGSCVKLATNGTIQGGKYSRLTDRENREASMLWSLQKRSERNEAQGRLKEE